MSLGHLMCLSDFNAPVLAGATPVAADIDRTLCLDAADVERKITPRLTEADVTDIRDAVVKVWQSQERQP
ncbi:MAG: hypothetical protein FJ279_25740 [Planctomycetes bacterium]|nr:hypothetical protein [Planctomycetota bacterium]MBM4079602.1 hypothetical protein [Planctomycetota bacterium]MBM4083860.1 hypothetical protein [Planctomycetota bacterium]